MGLKLYNENCLETLETLDENSIDTCITDPPYELGFMNKSWDSAGVSFQKETWEAVYRVLKPGALLLSFGSTRTWHRIAVAIEDAGFEIRDTIYWMHGQGFPKSYNISKGIDKRLKAKREEVGMVKGRGSNSGEGRYGWNDPNDKEDRRYYMDTLPGSEEAKLWDGWGTSLKPAVEPIIVAMKPIDGNYVNNALTHGVAGYWIDGGSVPTKDDLSGGTYGGIFSGSRNEDGSLPDAKGRGDKGRYPANVILDEEAAELLDKQTGIKKGGFVRNRTDGARPFENKGKDTGYETVAEIKEPDGGASRFFYCAKSNKKERNLGLDDSETNTHATVKPLELMKYLVRLTKTPTGGTVLDPFMGSGTTGMASMIEGRSFIGIEMEEESFEIAKKRIAHALLEK